MEKVAPRRLLRSPKSRLDPPTPRTHTPPLQEKTELLTELISQRDGLRSFLTKVESAKIQMQDLAVRKADAEATARGLRGLLLAARDSVEAEERNLAAASGTSSANDSGQGGRGGSGGGGGGNARAGAAADGVGSLEAVLRQSVQEQRGALEAQKSSLQVASTNASRRREDTTAAKELHEAAVRERAEVEGRAACTKVKVAELRKQVRGAEHDGGGEDAEEEGLEQQAAAAAALLRKRRAEHRALVSRHASLVNRMGCFWADRASDANTNTTTNTDARENGHGNVNSYDTSHGHGRASATASDVPGANFHQAISVNVDFEGLNGSTTSNSNGNSRVQSPAGRTPPKTRGTQGKQRKQKRGVADDSDAKGKSKKRVKRSRDGEAGKGKGAADDEEDGEEEEGIVGSTSNSEEEEAAFDSVAEPTSVVKVGTDFLPPLERIFGSILNVRLVSTTDDALKCQQRGSRSGGRIWALQRIDNPAGSLLRRHSTVTAAVRAALDSRGKRKGEGEGNGFKGNGGKGVGQENRGASANGKPSAASPTLDLETRVDGELVDPLALLSWDSTDPVATAGMLKASSNWLIATDDNAAAAAIAPTKAASNAGGGVRAITLAGDEHALGSLVGGAGGGRRQAQQQACPKLTALHEVKLATIALDHSRARVADATARAAALQRATDLGPDLQRSIELAETLRDELAAARAAESTAAEQLGVCRVEAATAEGDAKAVNEAIAKRCESLSAAEQALAAHLNAADGTQARGGSKNGKSVGSNASSSSTNSNPGSKSALTQLKVRLDTLRREENETESKLEQVEATMSQLVESEEAMREAMEPEPGRSWVVGRRS